MKKLLTILILFISSIAIAQPTARPEFKLWDPEIFNKMVSNGYVGTVSIFINPDVSEDSEITIIDKLLKFGTRKKYYLGKGSFKKGYLLALFPGLYDINVSAKGGFFTKEINISSEFSVSGGNKIQLTIDSKEIKLTNNEYQESDLLRGSITSDGDVRSLIRSYIRLQAKFDENSRLAKVYVHVTNAASLPEFKFNEKLVKPINSKVTEWNTMEYNFDLPLVEGHSIFLATAYGINGEPNSDNATFYIKTIADLEKEKIIKQKREDERNAKIEAEKRVRIAEEERIAREGDGSPDDLQCKKYGLKLQTQGYAECRMRLDLARRDQQREQQRDQQKQRDQFEQQRAFQQQQQQQQENADNMRKNRESQCRFAQAAEYAKPALGGFIESMQRANAAFDNCMNGIPTINTTCNKDVFGNINCTSR